MIWIFGLYVVAHQTPDKSWAADAPAALAAEPAASVPHKTATAARTRIGLRGGENNFASPTDMTSTIKNSVRARVGVRCTVRVALRGAVRKRDCHVLAAMRAVFERMDHSRNLHARGQGLGNPALPRQTAGRAKLDRPLLVINGHQDPAVRVRPLEFFDRAFQGHLLVGIEHREGMMCECRDRIHGNRDSRETKGSELHLVPPQWLIPARNER